MHFHAYHTVGLHLSNDAIQGRQVRWMGQHSHTAGVGHHAHRLLGQQLLPLCISGAVVADIAGKGLVGPA